MNKMFRKILLIFYVICLVFSVFVLVYNVFFNENETFLLENRHTVKFIIIFLFAIFSGRKSQYFYEKNYSNIIKDSFSKNKKLYNKLLKSISLYNESKFTKSIFILKELKSNCKTTNELYCVNLFLALNNTDMENYSESIKIYETMIQQGLSDSRVYSNLSMQYQVVSDFDKAIETCKMAILLNPSNYFAYNNLAYSYFYAADYENAIKNAKQSLSINEKCTQSIKLLVIIYNYFEDTENASKYEKLALENGITKQEIDETLDYYLSDLAEVN